MVKKVPTKSRVPARSRESSKKFGRSSAQGAGKKAKTGPRKFIAGIFFVLVVIQVVLANSLVTRGRGINQLSAERERLQAEISSLENEVAQTSSLTTIRQKAKELGMGPGEIKFLPPPPLASAAADKSAP